MPRSLSVPSYRHHKPSGQAVVTIRNSAGRRDVYLGVYNSPESRTEYARIIAELAACKAVSPVAVASNTTVDQVMLVFWGWAQQHYRRPDGTQTNEIVEYKYALRPLHELYGGTPAAEFGPLGLKTVRTKMVASGWCRTVINARVNRVRRAFKWAASEELIPAATFTALTTVAGLKRGRCEVRESEPVEPVVAQHVDATLPHVNRHVRGLIEFQRLTGCRPGEACAIRLCDVDTSEPVWRYIATQHKTAWRGRPRVIPIGPLAQAVLKPFFTDDPNEFLFSPRKAMAEIRAAKAANRKTPRYPSHMARNAEKLVKSPKRVPAARYEPHAYAVAVARAVETVNRTRPEAESVPHWTPNQLRHALATEVRKRYGLEAAQVVLGHAKADVTQVYAEKNLALAMKVAGEMG